MLSRRTCGVMVLVFAYVGCDSGEAESARVRECRNVCAKRDMCIRDTDLADCEKRCDDQEFRSDLYYQAKAACVSQGSLACDEWAMELDSRGEDLCLGEGCVLDACVQRELARHEISPEEEDYCQTQANKLSACDRTLDPSALAVKCEDTLLEVSPKYRDETETCVEMPCDEIRRCIDDLAERYGTDIEIF